MRCALLILVAVLLVGCWEMVPADKCNYAHLSSEASKDALASAWVECMRRYDGGRMAASCVELKLGCEPGVIHKRLDAEEAAVRANKELGEKP